MKAFSCLEPQIFHGGWTVRSGDGTQKIYPYSEYFLYYEFFSWTFRFEKRIYIALPEAQERADMFRDNMNNVRCDLTERDVLELGTMTEGWALGLLYTLQSLVVSDSCDY